MKFDRVRELFCKSNKLGASFLIFILKNLVRVVSPFTLLVHHLFGYVKIFRLFIESWDEVNSTRSTMALDDNSRHEKFQGLKISFL